MRILFALRTYHPNQFEIVAALQARGHEVHMAIHQATAGRGHPHLEPEKLGEHPSPQALWRLWRRVDPDVLIIRRPNLRWRLLSIWAKLFGRARLSYNLLPFVGSARRPVKQLRMLAEGRPSHTITPVFHRGRQDRGQVSRRFHYLPFPHRLLADAGRSYAPSGPVRIIGVGKLDQPRKRLDLLVQAVAELAAEVTVSLTLVGTGKRDSAPFAEVSRLIAENDLSDRVTIYSNLPQAEVLQLYREHDAFVLPASHEPLGFSVLEAMAAGCAVFTGDRTGAQHWVQPGINGAIFAAGSGTDLAARLRDFAVEPSRLAAAGRASLALVAARHSLQLYHDSLMALIAQNFPRQAGSAAAAHGTPAAADEATGDGD